LWRRRIGQRRAPARGRYANHIAHHVTSTRSNQFTCARPDQLACAGSNQFARTRPYKLPIARANRIAVARPDRHASPGERGAQNRGL
jgi:hypothetical protein